MDDFNGNPIHQAAKRGDVDAVAAMLDQNPDAVMERGWMGMLPLHYAAQGGSVECVRLLLDRGAEVNALCEGNRTNAAFDARNREVLDVLVEHGARLDLVSSKERVPLDYAIQACRADVVSRLIELGVDVNFAYGGEEIVHKTVLQWTMWRGENLWPQERTEGLRILRILLEAGADPNQQNDHGETAIFTAAASDLLEFVELLLAYGADPCIRNYWKQSCFDLDPILPEILALIEPHRSRLVPVDKSVDALEALLRRLLAIGLFQEHELQPCTDNEIARLERDHGVVLPLSYKKFLRMMGRGAGKFLVSDRWQAFMPDVLEELGTRYVERDDTDLTPSAPLPEHLFIFAVRDGCYAVGFIANGSSEEPEIYHLDEEGRLTKIGDTFWEWLQAIVEYYEFYYGPKLFRRR